MYTTEMGEIHKSGLFKTFSPFFPGSPPASPCTHLHLHRAHLPPIPGCSRPSHGPVCLHTLFPLMRMPFPVLLAAKFLLILLRPCLKSLLQNIPVLLSKQFPLLPSPHHFENSNNTSLFFNLFTFKTDDNGDQGPILNNFLNKSVIKG